MSPLVQLIDDALLDATLARARAAARGRINHNFHSELAANPSRFLNAWTRGSYACYLPGQAGFSGVEGERVGNLHFCGEHTSVEFQGYMNGGVESGERVAGEILGDLGVQRGAGREREREAPVVR